jgi:hypothetical protein
MRRSIGILPFLLALGLLGGCSGLSDVPTNGGGGGGGNGQSVALSVRPSSATVHTFGSQTLTATVTGSSNSAVTWQVNGVTGGSQTSGLISTSGAYRAPYSINSSLISSSTGVATATVTAISQASSAATSTVTITLVSQGQDAESGAVKLGTSGGNAQDINGNVCCSGTLGSLVTRNGTQYILSNNHVMARSDSGIVGDSITQPGFVDTNCQTAGTRTVANLSEFFNLETGPLPKLDAALAQVVNGSVDSSGNILLLGATTTNGVPDPGAPHAGTGLAATIGQSVAKSGRTTGLTCSTVLATGVAANVNYYRHCGDTTVAFTTSYTDLVAVTGATFSAEGDSGSLIVTQDTADPVALLFGGSDTDSVGNPVSDVLAAFPGAGNITPTFVGGAAHQVIGCTLTLQGAMAVAPQPQVSKETIHDAGQVRDLSAPNLLANPKVFAISVGRSYDRPGEAAILLFVSPKTGQPGAPQSIGGLGTRVMESDSWAYRGLLSKEETVQMLQTVEEPQLVYPLRAGEMQRASLVHAMHKAELLGRPEVLGVGISSSIDAPGEAALLIYVRRGASIANFPVTIDGVRTRFRESGPFMAGRGENQASRGCQVRASLSDRVKTLALGILPNN